MRRRTFLMGMASAGAFAVAGCAGPMAPRQDDGLNDRTGGPRPRPDVANGEWAKGIFERIAATGEMPASTDGPAATATEMKRLVASFGPLPRMLSIEEGFQVARLVARAVRGGAIGADPSLARPLIDDGVLVVPPRSVVRATFHGYCMDSHIPAPGKGEPMRIAPAADYFKGPALEAYQCGLRLLREGVIDNSDMQDLVWAMREIGDPKSDRFDRLSPKIRAALEGCCPGIWQELADFRKRLLLAGSSVATKLDPISNLLRGLVSVHVNGKPVSLPDLPKVIAQTTLGGLVPEAPAVPEDEGNPDAYSGYDPTGSGGTGGVAVQGTSQGNLTPGFTFVNTTNDPVRIEGAVAVTPSHRQRVAVGDAKAAEVLGGDAGKKEEGKTWKEVLDEWAADLLKSGSGAMRKLLSIVDDYGLPAFDVNKPWLPQIQEYVKNPFVKTAIEAIPGIGNLLSLYSGLTGLDWATGERVSWLEQGLDLFGAIPGENALNAAAKLAGKSGLTAMKETIELAKESKILSVAEATEADREGLEFASSEKFKDTLEKLEDVPYVGKIATIYTQILKSQDGTAITIIDPHQVFAPAPAF